MDIICSEAASNFLFDNVDGGLPVTVKQRRGRPTGDRLRLVNGHERHKPWRGIPILTAFLLFCPGMRQPPHAGYSTLHTIRRAAGRMLTMIRTILGSTRAYLVVASLHHEDRTMAKVYDEPSKVIAEEGVVLVDGPDGVAIALTPEAAADTSDRLLEGSAQAAGQRLAAAQDAAKRTDRR